MKKNKKFGGSLRRIVVIGVGLVVFEYLVVPQLAGARRAVDLLDRVNPGYLLIALALEVASWLAYAALTRSLLPRTSRPSVLKLTRIEMATLAVSHVVPGGNAAAAAVAYRLLGDEGVRGSDAGFALATQGLGSAVVLNAVLWIGLVVTIPLRGFQPLYAAAAALGAVLLAVFGALVLVFSRHEEATANLVRRLARPLPLIDEDSAAEIICRTGARVHQLAADRPMLWRAITWSAANWGLDAASLWVFLVAFGHRVGPDALVVSYGLANVVGALPITPGGLGVIEGVLVPALVGFGTPRGIALLGVVSWRLANFWLPIPLGAGTFLSLRLGPGERRRRATAELEKAVEEAKGKAQTTADWAKEHALRVRR